MLPIIRGGIDYTVQMWNDVCKFSQKLSENFMVILQNKKLPLTGMSKLSIWFNLFRAVLSHISILVIFLSMKIRNYLTKGL